MTLITIIFSLLLDRFADVEKSLRALDFIDDWINRGLKKAGNSQVMATLVLVVAIVLPAVLVHWVTEWFDDGLLSVIGFAWSIWVLFLCLGPLPLEQEIDAYLRAADADASEQMREQAGRVAGFDPGSEEPEQHKAVIRAGLAHVNTHIVAVLFWFVLLGPFGAVLYRLVLQLIEKSPDAIPLPDALLQQLKLILGLLGWLPARVVLLAYGLAGQFEGTLDYLFGVRSNTGKVSTLLDDNNHVLSEAGLCALGVDVGRETTVDDVRAARGLARRSVVVCLAFLAAMTLAGWFA